MIDTNHSESAVPMTKARAAEIVYESFKKAMMEEDGVINDKDHELLLNDFRRDLGGSGISDQEIITFVEFLKNDVNESIKKK